MLGRCGNGDGCGGNVVEEEDGGDKGDGHGDGGDGCGVITGSSHPKKCAAWGAQLWNDWRDSGV